MSTGTMSVGNFDLDYDHLKLISNDTDARGQCLNICERVQVPSSEHVSEIVGRQGCKIKILRARTNTYIRTPVRGEPPVFTVTGRREDVEAAKKEILEAAEHFTKVQEQRVMKKTGMATNGFLPPIPAVPGQITVKVAVPWRMVGLIVGHRGANIRAVQEETKTFILSPRGDGEPVFVVVGFPQDVDAAQNKIESCIRYASTMMKNCQPTSDAHLARPIHGKPSLAATTSNNGCVDQMNANSQMDGFHQSQKNIWSSDYYQIGQENASQEDEGIGDSPQGMITSFWRESNLGTYGSILTSKPNSNVKAAQTTNGESNGDYIIPRVIAPQGAKIGRPIRARAKDIPPIKPENDSVGSTETLEQDYALINDHNNSVATAANYFGQECIVCLDHKINAKLMPCEHFLFCADCAQKITEKQQASCPSCFNPVNRAIIFVDSPNP